jgi:hypothetical protein
MADHQKSDATIYFFFSYNGYMWEDFYAGLVNIFGLPSDLLVSWKGPVL